MLRREIPLILNQAAGQKLRLALWVEKFVIRPPALEERASISARARTSQIFDLFEKEGLGARLFLTQGPRDAERIARKLSTDGLPFVVAAGGDGTVNEVVNGLIGGKTVLGILPLGTANSLAIELGIPLRLEEAVRVLREGQTRTIDVGRAGNRYFAMGAGMSFDAHVIEKVTPQLKRLLGSVAYLACGLSDAVRYPFPMLELEGEDPAFRVSVPLAIVANARFYGGWFQAAPRARLDDGRLDVLVMKRTRVWDLLRYVTAMRKGKILEARDVEYFQCRKVKISSERPVAIHVDAEIMGKTPCEFECIPASLRVRAPRGREGEDAESP